MNLNRHDHGSGSFIIASAVGLLLCMSVAAGHDDVWELQNSGVNVSLRGVSAVSDICCWASGAKGTVIRTTDAGGSWSPVSRTGFHTLSVVSQSTLWAAGSEGRVARWRHDRPEQ